jgi:hypothetical protein
MPVQTLRQTLATRRRFGAGCLLALTLTACGGGAESVTTAPAGQSLRPSGPAVVAGNADTCHIAVAPVTSEADRERLRAWASNFLEKAQTVGLPPGAVSHAAGNLAVYMAEDFDRMSLAPSPKSSEQAAFDATFHGQFNRQTLEGLQKRVAEACAADPSHG